MSLFESLLGAIQVGGTLILSPVLRGWYNRWGAQPEEDQRTMPGDELVPAPMMGCTRAITIHAPAERVWSWLAQLGQGRGGLYSYDSLENLVGCHIRSVDRIIPEYQNIKPGDLIRLGPKGYPCFSVVSSEPGRTLILVSADPKSEQVVLYTTQRGKGYSIATWQFTLEALDDKNTRLFVRQRLAFSPDLSLLWRLTEPVSFVMERKMLLGIKHRAEHGV